MKRELNSLVLQNVDFCWKVPVGAGLLRRNIDPWMNMPALLRRQQDLTPTPHQQAWSGRIFFECSYDICEDSRPHEIDHLGHLIDVHDALILQLLGQRGQSTEHPCRHRSVPAGGRNKRWCYTVGWFYVHSVTHPTMTWATLSTHSGVDRDGDVFTQSRKGIHWGQKWRPLWLPGYQCSVQYKCLVCSGCWEQEEIGSVGN